MTYPWTSVRIVGGTALTTAAIADIVHSYRSGLPVSGSGAIDFDMTFTDVATDLQHDPGEALAERANPFQLVVAVIGPHRPEIIGTLMRYAERSASIVAFGTTLPATRALLLRHGIPVIGTDEEPWLARIILEGLGSLPEDARAAAQPDLRTVRLTRSEAIVAQLVIDRPGISRAEMVDLLRISEGTVKVHLRSIRRKTNLGSVRGMAFSSRLQQMWPSGVQAGPVTVSAASAPSATPF